MALGTTAQAGKDLIIKVKNDAGSPAFVAVAGLRARSIAFNAEVVDITNGDSAGQWREILAGVGIKSFMASGSGVATDFASYEVIRDMMFDGSLRDLEVTIPGFGVVTAKCKASKLELSGSHNDQLAFSITLESSGEATFVSA